MASAFKCDRCGSLYSERSIKPCLNGKNGPTVQVIEVGTPNYGKKFDLCESCAQDLVIWLEHFNISAESHTRDV